MIRAYEEQVEAVESMGGRIILMASRALAAAATGPDDYLRVYDRILSQVKEPVVIHWLGEMFDPALAGYWGSTDHWQAMETCLDVLTAHSAKIDGIKISLLSKDKEIAMRRRLPAGVRMYTGDDFNYAELIAGDAEGHSDALLGIFDAIAPAASSALSALGRGGENEFFDILAPTVPLSRHIFKAPDPLLQDRRRLPRLPQRPSGPFRHGRRPGERPLDPPPRRALPPRRHRRRPQGPRPRRLPDEGRPRRPRPAVMIEGLSINLATVRAQYDMAQAIDACLRHGITAIAPWRDQVAAIGLDRAARLVRDNGLRVTGLCRGGFFPAATAEGRRAAIDDNRRAIDEAAALDADCLVLVAGGLPEGSRDLPAARQMIHDGIAAILPHARAAGVPLAIEPLHPVYAADRACVNTLRQTLDLCDALGPGTGAAIDVYHVWWDPDLYPQLARAGAAGQILAHHICDWLVPTTDPLNDRGMMGDGVIDLPRIRRAFEAAGYSGPQEVEIFSAGNWWKRDGDAVLATCVERFRSVC